MAQEVGLGESTLWSELLHALPAMAYRRRHDANFTLLLASAGCHALTGYQPYELKQNNALAYAALIHPEDRLALSRKIAAALAEQTPYLCAYRLFTAAAEEKWVLDKGSGVFAADGTLRYLEGIVVDNTERVAAFQSTRRELVERTRKLAALYEIFSAPMTTADLTAALDRVLRRAVAAAQGDAVFLHLLDGEGSAHLTAHQGLSPAAVCELATLPPRHPLIADTVQTGRYRLLVNDGADTSTPLPCACCRDMDAYLGLPIPISRRVVGVLSLLTRDRNRFRPEEVELLISVAYQIGALVETDRLRQDVAHLAIWEERNRLARELHDAITQALYSIALFAEAGRRQVEKGDYEHAGTSLANVADIGQQALTEMRLLLHRLRPSLLEQEGLLRALQQRLATVEGRLNIRHDLQVDGTLALSPPVEDALYHICQEALNNALKHARATEVAVHLQAGENGHLTLSVCDNGRGFDAERALAAEAGMGLVTMRERAEALGGQITYSSTPGAGTTVHVTLQVDPALAGKEAP